MLFHKTVTVWKSAKLVSWQHNMTFLPSTMTCSVGCLPLLTFYSCILEWLLIDHWACLLTMSTQACCSRPPGAGVSPPHFHPPSGLAAASLWSLSFYSVIRPPRSVISSLPGTPKALLQRHRERRVHRYASPNSFGSKWVEFGTWQTHKKGRGGVVGGRGGVSVGGVVRGYGREREKETCLSQPYHLMSTPQPPTSVTGLSCSEAGQWNPCEGGGGGGVGRGGENQMRVGKRLAATR